MIELVDLVGLIGTVASTSLLLPSIYTQIRNHSEGMVGILVLFQVLFADLCWISYGVLTEDVYVFGKAGIAGFLCIMSIILYYRYTPQA
jgi:uncharacterized protein with PQ loop repeat